jgi:hypothetical protein
MDDEKVAAICRLCMLDPLKWKTVLSKTVEQFAVLRRSASASGPQVTLERAPRLIVWPGETETAPLALEEMLEEPAAQSAGEDMAEDDEDLEDEEDEE